MEKSGVNLHYQTAFVDPNSLKDESLRLAYLKMRARQVFVFNSLAATLIVISLMDISYAISINNTISNIISHINDKEKSITFFTLLYKKISNNKYVKYILSLIIICLIVLLPYSSIFTLPFLNFKIFTMSKVIGVLFTNLLILYNLLTLYYINKYSSIDSIQFSKYTPVFIKSYLMELYSISKLKDVHIIKEMVIKNTIFSILLQTVVIILLLVISS